MALTTGDILDGFGGSRKEYGTTASITGVESFPLARFVDDRGLLLEIYRKKVELAPSYSPGQDVVAPSG